MIKNHWYVVLDAAEVGRKPLGVKRFGERMVFWRDSKGQIVCQLDKCCHRGAQLSLGQVLGDCIECPFHGWQFDPTGRCTLVPSNGKSAPIPQKFAVKTYPVREAYGWIWLYWGDVQEGQELPPIRYFDELNDPRFGVATWQDPWPVHVTRAIENQLDVTHLSFTHKKTIGDPKRPVVDGPIFTWLDDVTRELLGSKEPSFEQDELLCFLTLHGDLHRRRLPQVSDVSLHALCLAEELPAQTTPFQSLRFVRLLFSLTHALRFCPHCPCDRTFDRQNWLDSHDFLGECGRNLHTLASYNKHLLCTSLFLRGTLCTS